MRTTPLVYNLIGTVYKTPVDVDLVSKDVCQESSSIPLLRSLLTQAEMLTIDSR
jgi:hypothetical protein